MIASMYLKNMKNSNFLLTEIWCDSVLDDTLARFYDRYNLKIRDAELRIKLSEQPRHTDGSVSDNPNTLKAYAGCWTSKKIIYVNPYAINAYCYIRNKDIKDVTYDEFRMFVNFFIAHELAHGVWEYYSDKKFRDSILASAKATKFTTDYLDWVRKNSPAKLEEETFCEYMADSIITKQLYLYHVVDNKYGDARELLAKYGICSPYDIYRLDKGLFHRRVYENYCERAKVFLKKSSVTDEDVLEYLDKGRPPCTSKCVFFAFETREELNLTYSNCVQFRIPLSVIEKYSIGNPIKFLGKNQTPMTFQELKDNLFDLKKQAHHGSRTVNKTGLRYKYIVHCAIPMKPIPISECFEEEVD